MVLAILLWSVVPLLLLGLLVFLYVTAYLYHVHRKYAHLPSPKPFSFYLGHLPAMAKLAKIGQPPNFILLDWYQQCGLLFVFFMVHHPFVVALDPKDIKELFMNPKVFKPPFVYGLASYIFGERFLGSGLGTEPYYEKWKPRRGIYDPAFNKIHLKTLIPAFNECAEQLVRKLEPLANGRTWVPMKKELSTVTLDIITKVAFGEDFRKWSCGSQELEGKSDPESGLQFLLSHVLEAVEIQFYYLFFQYIHPWKTKSYRDATKAIRKIGRDCIQRRIQALEKGEEVPNDILTQIIKVTRTTEDITLEDLVDDFATFYLAGQETTSNLLSFTLVMLVQHPAVLGRVQEEIAEIIGDREDITAEDIDQMEYTLQVLHETLRLYPPVAEVYKSLVEDTVMSGYRVPKHSIIQTSSFTACRLPENFEDPDDFNPSHFGPHQLKPDPFVYFPFGRGHRSCIGQVFALIEARIILARLLQKFQFSLPENYKLELTSRLALQPRDNVPCTLRLIEREQ